LRGFYSDFGEGGRLTPDEADKFFQLLEDRQMALMDSSANMMSGNPVDMKAATAATNTADEALKELLGSDRFGLYRDFEKTLGDRSRCSSSASNLGRWVRRCQDYQTQALIQIMSQERANLPGPQTGGAGMASLTPDQIDEYSKQVDAMNQRVYKPGAVGAYAAAAQRVCHIPRRIWRMRKMAGLK